MQELEIGKLLLISGEVWQIVGDYTSVETPIDYEIELTTNTEVWESFSERTIMNNIKHGEWKFVNVD